MTELAFKTQETALGTFYIGKGCIAFFGRKNAVPEDVAKLFPKLSFRFLKQVHSDVVVESKLGGDLPEADSHWTNERNVALCIRTADCLPILLHSSSGAIAAIHAGWRGLENEIILKTGVKMLEAGYPPVGFNAFVGPGIATASYEVSSEVGFRLEDTFKKSRFDNNASCLLPHAELGKFYCDLQKIARTQIHAGGVPEDKIWMLSRDTFTDSLYNSFRRDGDKAGRQFSFIALV